MSNKLQKVLSEIDKVKEKIAVQQTRLRNWSSKRPNWKIWRLSVWFVGWM